MNPFFLILQVLINGLLLAGVYGVAAIGLNLIFGVLRVANIAHGDFMMLGAFIVYSFSTIGIHPLIGIPIVAGVLFVLGIITERFLVEKVVSQPMAYSLLLLYAVSILLRNAGLNIWTSNYCSLDVIPGSLHIGPLTVSEIRLVIFMIALGLTLVFTFILNRTTVGKTIRASIQHPDLAGACGIDVRKIRALTFGVGSLLAGITGTFFIMLFSVNPEMGDMMILKLFAIVIVGGLGNYLGTFAGALVIAMAETLTGFYATTQVSDVAVFSIFLLSLILRPQGLLGGRKTR
ncbi:MAG TPA: branched-chain amino acid ABC transporter permease [Thermodesulfobacteriota bacterium]|nr:branched-chain amino acid ABC transporter permease [Thermodesulfobacteriota bacterium]